MKLTSDNLASHLDRQLLPAYLVSGDEPLLVDEAADAIRRKARSAGFTERQVFFVERGFDWNGLRTETQSLSLFAERRLLEVKLPTGKPGDGAEILEECLARPAADTLLLVLSSKLDRAAQNSNWVKAFEKNGGWLPVWPVDMARLPAWIAARMKRHGLEPDAEAAAFLAERVEGNLLAAQQEIDKLALLMPSDSQNRKIDAHTLAQVVANSARYDVFQLADAVLAGESARALRILDGLRSEGTEPTLVSWSLCRSLRDVWRQAARGAGPSAPVSYWQQKQSASIAAAARRLGKKAIPALIGEAVKVDRTLKGRHRGDAWDALEALVGRFSGVKI